MSEISQIHKGHDLKDIKLWHENIGVHKKKYQDRRLKKTPTFGETQIVPPNCSVPTRNEDKIRPIGQ